MTEEVPPTALTDVNLRLLCHDDIDAVKQLCGDWFPIEYVAVWIWVVAPSRSLCSELQPWAGAEQAAVLKLLCTPVLLVVVVACCHESWCQLEGRACVVIGRRMGFAISGASCKTL